MVFRHFWIRVVNIGDVVILGMTSEFGMYGVAKDANPQTCFTVMKKVLKSSFGFSTL